MDEGGLIGQGDKKGAFEKAPEKMPLSAL